MMRHRRRIRVVVCLLVLIVCGAHAARVDTGAVLHVAQDPFSNILVIGAIGEGFVTIDGGTQAVEDAVAIGGLADSLGTLTVTGAGSRLTAMGDPLTRASVVSVGVQGTGAMGVSGGGIVEVDGTSTLPGDLGAGIVLGTESGGVGTATVSGTGSMLLVRNGEASSPGIAVGLEGDGTLGIEGGAVVHVDTGTGENGGVSVGYGQAATGTLTIAGAGSALELAGTGTGLTVGNLGTGTLLLRDGGAARAQNAFVGLEPSGDGTLEVRDGATLAVSGTNPQLGFGGSLFVGLAGMGALEVSDGKIVLDNPELGHGLLLGGVTGCGGPCPFTGGSGVVSLGGPDAEIRIAGRAGGATIGADGSGWLDVRNGAALVIEDVVAGGVLVAPSSGSSGRVIVEGATSIIDAGSGLLLGLGLGAGGTLTDGGRARATVFNEGTIAGGIVIIGPAGRLDGDGVVAATVENRGGTIAPGALRSVLAIQGALVQSGGQLRLRLWSATPASSDRLEVAGPLTLAAGVVHVDLMDYLPVAGDEIIIATATGGVRVDPTVATSYAGAAPGFSFEVVARGNDLVFRALSDANSFGDCQASQLGSMATLSRGVFSCQASFVKKGNTERRDRCLATAEARFARTYQRAIARSAKRGRPCGLDATPALADDIVTAPSGEVVTAILAGSTPGADKGADALHAVLLRSTGTLLGAFLDIEARRVRRPHAATRDVARARARRRFEREVRRALSRATRKGVEYGGPAAPDIAQGTDALALGAILASFGIPPEDLVNP